MGWNDRCMSHHPEKTVARSRAEARDALAAAKRRLTEFPEPPQRPEDLDLSDEDAVREWNLREVTWKGNRASVILEVMMAEDRVRNENAKAAARVSRGVAIAMAPLTLASILSGPLLNSVIIDPQLFLTTGIAIVVLLGATGLSLRGVGEIFPARAKWLKAWGYFLGALAYVVTASVSLSAAASRLLVYP